MIDKELKTKEVQVLDDAEIDAVNGGVNPEQTGQQPCFDFEKDNELVQGHKEVIVHW